MNIVVLKGNLTRDPESRSVGTKGNIVVNFGMAINRVYVKADGTKDQEVVFIDCEIWDSGAETLKKYVKKGDPLLISGALKMDTWEADGVKKSKIKVRVSTFEFLKGKTDAAPSSESVPAASEPVSAGVSASDPAMNENIPF